MEFKVVTPHMMPG